MAYGASDLGSRKAKRTTQSAGAGMGGTRNREQEALDYRANYLRNQEIARANGGSLMPNDQRQPPRLGGPKIDMPSVPQPPTGAPSTPGTETNAQLYKPLVDLQNEASKYREDLKAGTGRIAGQIAGATGDWLAGMQNQATTDMAQRGIGGSGVEEQVRQGARDTATRAGAKQLGDLAVQREAMLGGAIQGALPITTAAPELALREKQLTMQGQRDQQSLAQQQYQNQLQASNQAFNQYMALLQQQRNNQPFTGFSI